MGIKKRIQYRYTPTGQKSLMIDPDGGRHTYLYDDVKQLTTVINPQGQRTSYSYDPAGRRTAKKLANGSRTSFSYDLANRITAVAQLKSDASVQAKYDYKYDKVGNRLAMAESGHTTTRTTWSYDAAYQLTGEHRTGSNAYRNTYVYDTRGNRTLKNLDGARTTSSYDDANQLKWTDDGSGRTTYTFDADGNQQVVLTPAGQRTTSVWDYENKLVGVLNPSGTRETMAYDPDGRRVKHQATDTVKYVWDQENYLQETNASDVTQAVYTNEPRTYGNLISQRKSGATHYYVFDALGSTRLLTDSSEAASESLLYDAWGNLVGSAPSMAVPFRWVGELGYLFVPSSGDYSVRARIYRSTIGRWVSKDPLRFANSLNCYTYVKNSLCIVRDPTGLRGETGFSPRDPSQVFPPNSDWLPRIPPYLPPVGPAPRFPRPRNPSDIFGPEEPPILPDWGIPNNLPDFIPNPFPGGPSPLPPYWYFPALNGDGAFVNCFGTSVRIAAWIHWPTFTDKNGNLVSNRECIPKGCQVVDCDEFSEACPESDHDTQELVILFWDQAQFHAIGRQQGEDSWTSKRGGTAYYHNILNPTANANELYWRSAQVLPITAGCDFMYELIDKRCFRCNMDEFELAPDIDPDTQDPRRTPDGNPILVPVCQSED